MRYWTCQRVSKKKKCGTKNPARNKKCLTCGKTKPVKRRPAHMAALDIPYEQYVKLNGGDFCYICGRKPSLYRRLDRDHDHITGKPRGLLCFRCNRHLPVWITSKWLRKAAEYLDEKGT